MQTVIAFDTHSLVKRLKSVGFTEEQSEVFAEEQARIIDERWPPSRISSLCSAT